MVIMVAVMSISCIGILTAEKLYNLHKKYFYLVYSCWSYVGRTTRRKQALSLNIPQCMSKGYIMHELMHAVGFRHEHSRSDRDKYIYLVRENINSKDVKFAFDHLFIWKKVDIFY